MPSLIAKSKHRKMFIKAPCTQRNFSKLSKASLDVIWYKILPDLKKA